MQEVFDKIAEKLSNSYRNVNSDSDLEWNRAIYECAEMVKTIAAEYNNGWIPTSERLPEEYRNEYRELIPFLVCEAESDFPFRAFYDGKGWGDGICKLDVIAWQPLPEAYKG